MMSQYVQSKHNTTWKVLCMVYKHLFLKSHLFTALTCTISDTLTTCA